MKLSGFQRSIFQRSQRSWKRVHRTRPQITNRHYSDGYIIGWKAVGKKSRIPLIDRAEDAALAHLLIKWEEESDFVNGWLHGYRAAQRSRR